MKLPSRSKLIRIPRNSEDPLTTWGFRSQDAANRIISEIKTIQPDTVTTFIRKDLTLLKNVDEVCDEIKAKEKNLNLLFMSQGTMSVKGRDGKPLYPMPSITFQGPQHHSLTSSFTETSEGLDRKLTTNYYSRMRFTHSSSHSSNPPRPDSPA